MHTCLRRVPDPCLHTCLRMGLAYLPTNGSTHPSCTHAYTPVWQTYPAHEYDFAPKHMYVDQGDFVHFQWEVLYIGSILASPTACLLRGYGCAGTQNDLLAEAVILSTGTPIPAQ